MIHPVIKILSAGDIAELVRADRTDGQLLDQYVKTRDADAFAMLVRRHGGLVLGVCRRVLRNHADADDAFQAAFLVLARKAATLRTRGLLSSWLHGVALNTARKLLRANARRAARERPLAEAPEPAAEDGIDLREELLAILDEGLGRLPERYRVPIVLCDLEGATRKEAARLIGCPEGTVAGRLARARALLAERLAGRGIAPTAGILAAILTAREAGAGVQASGVMRAIAGDVSLRVASLAERVVAAMFVNKLKSSLVAVLACGLVLAGLAAGFRTDVSANADPMTPPGKPADKPAGEPKVLTMIPLRFLEPETAATTITAEFKGKGITVAAIPDERAVLLYADAKTTREVEELLVKLGERFTKKESAVLRLKETKCTEAAKTLLEIFNGPAKNETSRVTIVPVPDENSLLVYASPIDMLTIRRLLDKTLDAAPPLLKPKLPEPGAKSKLFTLNFKGLPWKDAIAWYAEISGLSFVGDTYPKGTVTLQPPQGRKFTLGEVTDIFNEALIQQKFLLIRRKTTFILHPTDEKIDPTFMLRVELDGLKNYGKTELVEVELSLDKQLDAAEIEPEIRKLLTPFGTVAYAKGQRLVLRDTAGNVSRIWEAIHTHRNQRKPQPEYLDPRDPRQQYDPRYDPRFDPRGPAPRSALPTMPMAKTTTFRMKNAPWGEVLDWYSKYSGLTPSLTTVPTGKFTFTPPKPDQEYTLGEITDILNESLAAQKLILLRRQTSFLLHPLDKMIEVGWIPRIDLDDLPNFGNGELVQVLIPLKGQTVDEAEPDVKKMLSPQGVMSSLARTNTLVIVDTAGSIRRIIKVLEGFNGKEQTNVYEFYHCKWQKADDVSAELTKRLNDKIKDKNLKVIVVAERASNSLILLGGPKDTLALAKKLIAEIDAPKTASDKPVQPAGPARFPMQFKDTPWADVLEWYSKISGLTPILTVKPKGKFTFSPPKPGQEYTLAEITDILNEAMAPQKCILVRRQVSFYIHPTDKKFDPSWVPRIEISDLPTRGKSELVQLVFNLKNLASEDTAPEIAKMLTPFGTISMLRNGTLILMDTAGNITRVLEVIQKLDGDVPSTDTLSHVCKYKRAQVVADHLMKSLADKKNAKGVEIAVDEKDNSVTVNGSPVQIALAKKLIAEIDAPKTAVDKPLQPAKPEPKRFPMQFKGKPWADVLDWYGKVSGLTPILTLKPEGKFTFTPPKPGQEYTLAEITDILNEAMAPQKFILIRRQVSFYIHPTDEKIDGGPPQRVELSDLSNYGKTELVQVIIPLKKLDVVDVAPEIKRLLTPYGTMSSLSKSNSLIILDTAGNVRRILETIKSVEDAKTVEDALTHVCKYKKAEDVADHLKKSLADSQNAKGVEIAVDEKANSMTVKGSTEQIDLAKKIIAEFDKGFQTDPIPDDLVLRKYPVPAGTADAIAKALLKENPALRIVVVQGDNYIWVQATREEHVKLAAKLKPKEKKDHEKKE